MWYGNGCGDNGWHSLLVFLLVIATIFVFVGYEGGGKRYRCADGEAD